MPEYSRPSQGKRARHHNVHKSSRLGDWLKFLVVLATSALLFSVVGIGVYFFWDQVIVEKLDLRSPPEKAERAVSRILSPVRDPADQLAAIQILDDLRGILPTEELREYVAEVDAVLPDRIVAAEVFDAWIVLRKDILDLHEIPYADVVSAVNRFELDSTLSHKRLRFYVENEGRCRDELLVLAQAALESTATSDLEKTLAAQARARWDQDGECEE